MLAKADMPHYIATSKDDVTRSIITQLAKADTPNNFLITKC